MRKNAHSILAVVLFISLVSFSGQAWAYSGGFGTEAEPYEIATPADLKAIGDSPLDWNLHFIQTADIDMSYYDGSDPDHTYNSIGIDSDHTFTGTYYGNGFTISNLTIDKPGENYIGMFGYIGNGAQVNSVGLIDIDITGNYLVGGLCAHNEGTINNCYTTGTINNGNNMGGLCGENSFWIINSFSATTVITNTSDNSIGGFCGINHLLISNCFATGVVSGGSGGEYIGGFCGMNSWGNINNCYSTGNVSGDDKVGGFCGSNHGNNLIEKCYSVGSVTEIVPLSVEIR